MKPRCLQQNNVIHQYQAQYSILPLPVHVLHYNKFSTYVHKSDHLPALPCPPLPNLINLIKSHRSHPISSDPLDLLDLGGEKKAPTNTPPAPPPTQYILTLPFVHSHSTYIPPPYGGVLTLYVHTYRPKSM